MRTIRGVEYSAKSKLAQGSLFHRGPGSTRFLIEVIVSSQGEGKQVFTCCNTMYTSLVEQAVIHVPTALGDFSEKGAAEVPSTFTFGEYDFTQTVGLWLKESQGDGNRYLPPFISIDSFKFTPDEFLELRERLVQTIRKNDRHTTVSDALADLNTGFFRHQTLEECNSFITQHLTEYLGRSRDLKRRFLVAINSHARRSIFLQRGKLQQRSIEVGKMANAISQSSWLAGRSARKQQQLLKEDWAAYRLKWYGVEDAPMELPDEQVIQQEQAQLTVAKTNLSRELAAANLSLSHVTVDPDLGDADEFLSLAEDLDRLVLDIDESGLYQLPLSGASAATASRQLQRLEGVLQQLNNSYLHLEELPDFYAHRHFWYAQPARLRRLLAPLQGVPTNEWGVAFSSWYFDRCLEQYPDPVLGEYKTVDLATWLKEIEPEVQRTAPQDSPVFLRPGEAIPPTAEVLVDFTGKGPPEGFTGTYIGRRPLTDTGAKHHALASVVDPRLVLQQAFIPLSPPSWKIVQVEQAPPGAEGKLSFQLNDEGNWEHLVDWEGEPVNHLRLYLPEAFVPGEGETFLTLFEEIINNADALTLFHDWSPAAITQALLSDGLNPSFLMAALLRAAEACTEEPFDQDALVAVGKEIRLRCGLPDPVVHPLAEQMQELLQERLPDHFFTLHQPWRDTFLPLVVLSPTGKKTVLLPGGRLPGQADKYTEALRQRELSTAGLPCLEISAYACWEDVDTEVERLVNALASEK